MCHRPSCGLQLFCMALHSEIQTEGGAPPWNILFLQKKERGSRTWWFLLRLHSNVACNTSVHIPFGKWGSRGQRWSLGQIRVILSNRWRIRNWDHNTPNPHQITSSSSWKKQVNMLGSLCGDTSLPFLFYSTCENIGACTQILWGQSTVSRLLLSKPWEGRDYTLFYSIFPVMSTVLWT